MNRVVITRIEHKNTLFTVYLILDENRKVVELQAFEPEEKSFINNIYVARVEKIIPNIEACFVKIKNGQKCYLPFSELKSPFFCKKQSKDKPICEGDLLLVQVTRDAVKTKDPVVSTKLSLHGRYTILTSDNTSVGVSKKIGHERTIELMTLAKAKRLSLYETLDTEKFGLVIRTNAAETGDSEIEADIAELANIYKSITTEGLHRAEGELLHRNMPGCLSRLKAQDPNSYDIIYTDEKDIYDEIASFLPGLLAAGKLRLYDDPAVSLSTLYNLSGNMDEILGKLVWLRSGANIIIEQLETLTVIDVNSSKNISRKPEVLFSINCEAAIEIARQLKLRNISGMIIVDFINMSSYEQQKELTALIKRELKKDNVPARFVDITKLGLVEITRRKTYRSLKEIMR